MRVYLSGAMRGIPESNFPEFNRVAKILRQFGHDVLNPAESSISEREHMTRHDFLRHDIQLILCVDAVVVMPGWQTSPGARFEVAEAWQIGIPVYLFRDHYKGFNLDLLPEYSVVIPREYQYEKRVPVIGLSGFAGAGKDEVGRVLVEDFGFTRVAFADTLKEVATAIGWDGQKDEVGRKLLQDLGVAVRDHLHADAWVQAVEDKIEALQTPVVITDVRFPNEVMMVKRRKGVVVRDTRPGVGAVNAHISEHAVTDSDADSILANDGTLDELPVKVKSWMAETELWF